MKYVIGDVVRLTGIIREVKITDSGVKYLIHPKNEDYNGWNAFTITEEMIDGKHDSR